VKIGAGFEDNKGSVYHSTTFAAVTSPTYAGNQIIVGASAPIGNLRVGLAYGRNSESGVLAGAQANGDEVAKGFVTSADYSFSKRTTLNVSYSDIKRTGGAVWANGYNGGATTGGTTVENTTNSGSQYRVRLMHSF
jgi:predicted porin